MKPPFFIAVKEATPKISLKLADSPFWEKYLTFDNELMRNLDLRVEGVKAFCRFYQNNKSKLQFTIEEVEDLISRSEDFGGSTDKFFDNMLLMSLGNTKGTSMLFWIFAYLRNELPTSNQSEST